MALSALINAMYESNSCAIVRRVYQANSKVQLGCLVPHIKADYEVSSFSSFYPRNIEFDYDLDTQLYASTKSSKLMYDYSVWSTTSYRSRKTCDSSRSRHFR